MAKRYFWLKLKTDFFESKEIKLLRRVAGGDTFTIIYLKMLLNSLKDDGFLYFDGVCNDIAEEIALTLDEEVESVRLTLAFLESKKLIEYGVNDDLKMARIDEMIGSETDKAELMRKNRERKRMEALHCNSDVTKEVTTLPEPVTMLPDVTKRYTEIEKEIDIEKDIDIEKEKKKREPRHRHGEYNHILLTDKQYEKLVQDFTEPVIADVIKRMDEWCQMQGRSYKDYNLAIRKWLKEGPANNNKTVTHIKQSEFTNYKQRDTDYDKLEKDLLGWE